MLTIFMNYFLTKILWNDPHDKIGLDGAQPIWLPRSPGNCHFLAKITEHLIPQSAYVSGQNYFET